MNGKRAKSKKDSQHVTTFLETCLIEERVGESDKAFHDFTTCRILSWRVKSTGAWERIEEKEKSIKAWGRVYKASHLRSNPRRSAIAIPRDFSKVVAGGGRSFRSARFARSAFGERGGEIGEEKPLGALGGELATLRSGLGPTWPHSPSGTATQRYSDTAMQGYIDTAT